MIAANNSRSALGMYTIEFLSEDKTVLKEFRPVYYGDLDRAKEAAVKLARGIIRQFRHTKPMLVSVWSVRINGTFSGDYHFWIYRSGSVRPALAEDVLLPDQQ